MRRRGFALGAVAGGLAAVGATWGRRALFGKHYPPTPYDDVLARLVDREQATKLGQAALKSLPGFDARAAATGLRLSLNGGLSPAVAADALAGRIREVDGWLLPENLAQLSALAAKA
jgi:hypothetical protein